VYFFGHEKPYLLRPADKHCKFLGACYLPGYMRGEAVEELQQACEKKNGLASVEWSEFMIYGTS
jgi:hypothetical protein